MAVSSKEKIREIYEVLPKLNCGFCGLESCGQFARAVAEGRASPFGCRQNPWAGYRISEIIEVKVPAYSYGRQSASTPRAEVSPSIETLRDIKKEAKRLSQEVNDILARIENLKAIRGGEHYGNEKAERVSPGPKIGREMITRFRFKDESATASMRRRGLGRGRWKRS
ncbi:MAG TPA: hypothetical protein G4O12_06250 [Dehalococcoidia bacterium]|nr:hypothetical protein [Dehalococcoidia bacterium]